MTHRQRLKLASVKFAVLWICVMLWMLPALKLEQIGMIALSGVLAGLVGQWAFGLWLRWRLFPRKRAA